VSAVRVKACLNGTRTAAEHPAVPATPEELAADAHAAVSAGAFAVHVHPRAEDGGETLDRDACGAAVAAIGHACPGLPISLSTGAWIEPDPDRRLAAIAGWDPAPQLASVNLSEDGAFKVCELLIERGIGVEAGLQGPADAEALLASGLAPRCARALVEVEHDDPDHAAAVAAATGRVLDEAGVALEQIHHGLGIATWAVIDAAIARGRGVRVGLEDTLVLPDGSRARDNAQLVVTALARG
jgi:uncharacterized protein (DUF849 family)